MTLYYSQLSKCILKISDSYLKSAIKNKIHQNIINIGGDEELSYEKIILRIKDKLSEEFLIRKCFLIKIPNRLFFFMLSSFILISPKNYAAILRISVNMGGFKPSYKITGENKVEFPLRIKK